MHILMGMGEDRGFILARPIVNYNETANYIV